MEPGSFVVGKDGVKKPNLEDEAMRMRQNPPQSPFEKGGSEAGGFNETGKEVKDGKK